MIQIALLGGSGYGGSEVIRILHNHPHVKINYIGAKASANANLSSVFKHFNGFMDYVMLDCDLDKIARNNDCIIAATPHNFLANILHEDILKHCVVIDLSADFRLKQVDKYEEYYGFSHTKPDLLQIAEYGLCEINAEAVKHTNLIANPGCYPTASSLSIAPMLAAGLIDTKSIIIDAKSGVSGAGRGSKIENLFCEINENIKPYALTNHRHTAEIEQNLSLIAKESLQVSFTPHVVPMSRGILSVAYASLMRDITQEEIDSIYMDFYKDAFFVKILPNGMPLETKWVSGSNFVKISAKLDIRTNRIIMMGVIDNLIKGAAGAAVQNLNLRFGFNETLALESLPLYP